MGAGRLGQGSAGPSCRAESRGAGGLMGFGGPGQGPAGQGGWGAGGPSQLKYDAAPQA